MTWYISANRDEEFFADPYRFDVTRKPNDHVTFGPGGPHFCLGAHLARLETKILFQELLPRLASIELAGPVERIRSQLRERHQADAGPDRDALVRRCGPATTARERAQQRGQPILYRARRASPAIAVSSALNRGKSCSIVVRPARVSDTSTAASVVGVLRDG